MNVNVTFDIYLATRKADFATLQMRKVRKVYGEERRGEGKEKEGHKKGRGKQEGKGEGTERGRMKKTRKGRGQIGK